VIGGNNSNYYDAVNKAYITVFANQDNADLTAVAAALHKVTVQFEK
jgi:hypothetical protein